MNIKFEQINVKEQITTNNIIIPYELKMIMDENSYESYSEIFVFSRNGYYISKYFSYPSISKLKCKFIKSKTNKNSYELIINGTFDIIANKIDINNNILMNDTECNTIDDLHGYTPHEYNLKIKYNDIIKDFENLKKKQIRNKQIRNKQIRNKQIRNQKEEILRKLTEFHR